jgi:hypothetical protein
MNDAPIAPPAKTRNAVRLLSNALRVASLAGCDRLTVPQLLFFLTVAEADLARRVITLTDIQEGLGDAIGRSLHTTYKTLLVPRGKTNANAIGWLKSDANPDDLRQRFLSLTSLGREIIDAMAGAIEHNDHPPGADETGEGFGKG